jgi:ATP-dependent helicase YprA (DUF1998 family)
MKSVFKIHESIVNDYKSYVSSFIQIKNDEIREIVESDIDLGKLWPEALLRFNPSFEKGESVKSLIDTNVLHSELENVFTGYNLYKHQVDALRLGTENKDFFKPVNDPTEAKRWSKEARASLPDVPTLNDD